MPKLKITRRHLPHWQLEGSIYFVTFDCVENVMTLEETAIVLEQIKMGDDRFYDLFAVVVMPDHVHLLLRPVLGYDLTRVMKGIKGVCAHEINLHRGTKGTIWKSESYDRIVRSGREFDEELNYMYNNPIKKGITDIQGSILGGTSTKRNAVLGHSIGILFGTFRNECSTGSGR